MQSVSYPVTNVVKPITMTQLELITTDNLRIISFYLKIFCAFGITFATEVKLDNKNVLICVVMRKCV